MLASPYPCAETADRRYGHRMRHQTQRVPHPFPSTNQSNTMSQFNPAEVPINYTLNFNQVNLILDGMAELPRKQTEGFYDQFRAVALQTLKQAEGAHKEAIEQAEINASGEAA